uniref:Uncharacterized protein n=1 Tax=Rhizophora mucronata TaxID=61149 RepID=A0A2P2P0D0_RHIMU
MIKIHRPTNPNTHFSRTHDPFRIYDPETTRITS